MRTLLSLPLLLASALSNAFVQARPVQASISCAAPVTGQYLIVSQGLRGRQPMGSLQLETWLPNGSVSGTRFLRVGRTYRETKYEGRWESESDCGLTVTEIIKVMKARFCSPHRGYLALDSAIELATLSENNGWRSRIVAVNLTA